MDLYKFLQLESYFTHDNYVINILYFGNNNLYSLTNKKLYIWNIEKTKKNKNN